MIANGTAIDGMGTTDPTVRDRYVVKVILDVVERWRMQARMGLYFI
jgi:hypothetical protein